MYFFSGIVTGYYHNTEKYSSVRNILKVNYAFTHNDSVLSDLCSYSYILPQNSDWEDELVLEAIKYYDRYYENGYKTDKVFYYEYLVLLSEHEDFSSYKEICEKLLNEFKKEKIYIVDSLKVVYEKGGINEKNG